MSLKVCPHPRGHVASCNGSLHSFKTKVEQYPYDPSLSASQRAALVEEWTEKETQRKALKLAQFQKEVKLRVSAREKLIQQEMVATSSKAMQSEQAAVERALRLDDTKVEADYCKFLEWQSCHFSHVITHSGTTMCCNGT